MKIIIIILVIKVIIIIITTTIIIIIIIIITIKCTSNNKVYCIKILCSPTQAELYALAIN